MSGIADALVAVAIVALVIARQVRPRRVSEGRSWWILPAVLVFLAVRQGGWTDPHHEAASVALLAAELAVGVCMGTVWAFTSRIWRDEAGVAWVKGTKATAAAWIGGILLRVGLAGLGAVIGVHEGGGSIMLALAATLLVRTGVIVWRVGGLDPAAHQATAAL
jgi:hypothetical protein